MRFKVVYVYGQNVRRWVSPQSLNGRAERLVSILWAWIST